jgi:hypothetical protein
MIIVTVPHRTRISPTPPATAARPVALVPAMARKANTSPMRIGIHGDQANTIPTRNRLVLASTSYTVAFLRADDFLGLAPFPASKLAQCRSFTGFSPLNAFFTAISVTAFTIQSKFS